MPPASNCWRLREENKIGDETMVGMMRENDLTARAAENDPLPGAGPPPALNGTRTCGRGSILPAPQRNPFLPICAWQAGTQS